MKPPLIQGYFRLSFRSCGKTRRCWAKAVKSDQRHFHKFWRVSDEGEQTNELLILHDLDIIQRLVAVMNTKYGLLEVWRES